MQLVHHTTKHALKNIIKDKFIYPVYDYVWLTENMEGEMTAGMIMPEEHKACIVIDIPEDKVFWVHEMIDELPHLNFGLLNMITDTAPWYLSKEPIPDKYFISTNVMKDSKWIPYKKWKGKIIGRHINVHYKNMQTKI